MSNSNPVGPMVFLGTPEVGKTLTARPNSITDDNGINTNTDSFQWLRNGEPIPGATGQFYTLQSADLNAQISVSYLYTDLGGTREVVTSVSKSVIAAETPTGPTLPTPVRDVDPGFKAPGNSAPEGPMGILGDALVGETLTARPNAIRDADGINYSTAKFQWLRDGQEIAGANNQTYIVTNADRGTQISVEYTYVDSRGSFERVLSEPEPFVPGGTPSTPPVVVPTPPTPPAPPVVEPPVEPPVETPDDIPDFFGQNNPAIGKLIIYGFPVLDAVLEARTDAVFDREGFDRDGGSYQWFRDGEPISGATGTSYRVTQDDLGTSISLQYTFVDFGGTTETMVSDPEPPVPFPAGMEPPETPDVTGGGERVDQPGTGGDTSLTTPQDDTVTITASMTSVDGLDGTDTAVLAGDQTDYTVTLGQSGITVTDRNADGLGTVDLTNFEFLDFGTELPDFSGGAMDLTQFGGHTGLSAADFEAFVEMYIAYFNRAPDAIGLGFWGTSFANGTSMEEIASMFADQPETLATYPAETSNIRFTADVYENVLGRSPDIDGLRFWTDALDSGAVSRGEFILEVLQGVKAPAPAGATQEFLDRQAADLAYLEAKTDLGAHFAVHRGMSNVEDAAMVMALFDGSAGSLATAVEAVDTLYVAAQDPVNGDFLMPLVGVLDAPFVV